MLCRSAPVRLVPVVLGAVLLALVACRPSSPGLPQAADSTPTGAVAVGTSPTAASTLANDGCPLTADEVSAALGIQLPRLNSFAGPNVICTFRSSATQLFSAPAVDVQPFPLSDQPAKTLPDLRASLSSLNAGLTAEQKDTLLGQVIDQPSWGTGAFEEITRHPTSELAPKPYWMVEDWLPRYHLTIVLPDGYPGISANARAVGKALGDKAAAG
jgi:hypothetical protein